MGNFASLKLSPKKPFSRGRLIDKGARKKKTWGLYPPPLADASAKNASFFYALPKVRPFYSILLRYHIINIINNVIPCKSWEPRKQVPRGQADKLQVQNPTQDLHLHHQGENQNKDFKQTESEQFPSYWPDSHFYFRYCWSCNLILMQL